MIYSAFYVLMPISLIINFLCRFFHLIKTGNCWKICSLTFAVDDLAPTDLFRFSHMFCLQHWARSKASQWPSARQKSSNWVMKCKTNLFWTPISLLRQQTRQTRQTRRRLRSKIYSQYENKGILQQLRHFMYMFIIYQIYWRKHHVIKIPPYSQR